MLEKYFETHARDKAEMEIILKNLECGLAVEIKCYDKKEKEANNKLGCITPYYPYFYHTENPNKYSELQIFYYKAEDHSKGVIIDKTEYRAKK